MKPLMTVVALAAALALNAAEETKSRLTIGDPAPELKMAKWFKGQEVPKLEAGKIYVVEFWATWCGPCKVSIPHLTEVAHKFKGKAQIIGVSVWERAENETARFEMIEKFVKEMGDKMDYSVGADVEAGHMAKAWMQAAEESGIPSSFIVGKDGKIAWIGHPMSGLDKALEEVIAGTFDAKAAAEQRIKAKEAQAIERGLMKKITELRKEGKNKEALAELDQASAANPELGKRLSTYRLSLLIQTDEAAAVKEIRKQAEGEQKDNARGLANLANLLVTSRKEANYDLAVELAKKACAVSKDEDPMIISLLADAHFAKKDFDQAIAAQERAMKALEKDPKMPESYRSFFKTKMERFQKAKAEQK